VGGRVGTVGTVVGGGGVGTAVGGGAEGQERNSRNSGRREVGGRRGGGEGEVEGGRRV